jgi:hypothetical protein
MFFVSFGVAIFDFSSDPKTQQIGSYVAFISILLYLLAFSIGLGATPWTVNSEIYPLNLRGAGNSASTFGNWFSNFLVSESFLTVTHSKLGTVLTFAAIASICILGWFFVYKMIPETKGKTFEEIQNEILSKSHNSPLKHKKIEKELILDTDDEGLEGIDEKAKNINLSKI